VVREYERWENTILRGDNLRPFRLLFNRSKEWPKQAIGDSKQVGAACPCDGGSARGDIELREDVGNVAMNGVFAQVQAEGNLFVAEA
jgi:hypothetical protein